MTCNKCGANLPEDSKFCAKCGNKVEVPAPKVPAAGSVPDMKQCPNCGNMLNPQAMFCAKCGTKLGDSAPNANAADQASVQQTYAQQSPVQPQQNLQNVQNIQSPQGMQNTRSMQNMQEHDYGYDQDTDYGQSIAAGQFLTAPDADTPKSGSKAWIIILIIAAVVLIGGLTAGFFIWKSMNSLSIDTVKDGYFEEIPKKTIGSILEKIHVDPESDVSEKEPPLWSEKKSLSGCTVTFEGKNIYDESIVEIRFAKGKGEYPEVTFVSIDDDETDKEGLIEYLDSNYRDNLSIDLLNGGKKIKPTEPETTVVETTIPEIVFTVPETTTTVNKSGYTGMLPTGGDQFTILSWNASDVDPMLSFWQSDSVYRNNNVNFVNFNVGGGEAAAQYDQYFLGGSDVDIFMVESDWALKYLNNDSITAPMSSLGFTDRDFANQYPYTLEVGKDSYGVLKGVSWNAAPGCWCYRSDLAETYLGVRSPEEMQSRINNWAGFEEAAAEVAAASNGKTAMTTSLGGVGQAYLCSSSSPLVDSSGSVLTDTCRSFVNFAKTMYGNGYISGMTQWSNEWYAIGQTNQTMGYFISTWGFGDAILTSAAGGVGGATYGKWNCTEGPAPFYWGGVWLCTSARTDNADIAADFIRYFTIDEESMMKYAVGKEGGEFVNNMNVMQSIIDSKLNSNSNLGGQDQYAVLHESAKNINLKGAITPYDAAAKSAIIYTTEDYCRGGISSESECLNMIQEDFSNYYY